MSNDLQSDLTADLLRDLSAPTVAPAVAAPEPGAVGPPPSRRPALSIVFTPLHWARVSVGPLEVGTGLSVRGGPWRVDVAV